MGNLMGKMKKSLKRFLSSCDPRNNRNYLVRTILFKSDIERWKLNAQNAPSWDERNQIIAGIIPDRSSVIDIGAGAQTLREYLKPGCVYQPCDLVKGSEDTLLCDFNQNIFPVINHKYDYVICSGVLEYIRSPEQFLKVASGFGGQMIISYAVKLPGTSSTDRLKEGWVNHLSKDQIEDLFRLQGFEFEYIQNWKHQLIWKVKFS